MAAKSGKLVVTQRAISQDAEQAMRGDPVRALIELITNADDAYQGGEGGVIRIEVVRQSALIKSISVTDNAIGLDQLGMERCFTTLGDETSRVNEGVAARGIFGRGAKDTAWFGRTEFESIKDGKYNRLVLLNDSTWSLDETTDATSEIRSRLGIPGGSNGLRATIFMEREVRTSAPELMRKISSHVQLRDIYGRRQVFLADRGVKSSVDRVIWTPPSGEQLVDATFRVEGYEGEVHLTLVKLDSLDSSNPNEYSKCGIEIYGVTAGYENTLFDFRDPGVNLVHGRLTSATIDALIKSYDVAPSERNQIRLVSRDRDGLVREHPYYQALKNKVLDIVAPIFSEWAKQGPAQVGGDDLQRDMNDAARVIGALLKEDLGSGEVADPAIPTQTSPLVIIPPRVKIGIGSSKTLSVRFLASASTEPDFEVVISSSQCVRRIEKFRTIEYVPSGEYFTWSFQIEGVDLGSSDITVLERHSGATAVAQALVVIPEEDLVEIPQELQFASSLISVTKGKTRTVRVQAPIELAKKGTENLSVALTMAPGGCELLTTEVVLSLNREGFLEGKALVRGTDLGEPLVIEARGGGQIAEAKIKVSEPQGISVGDMTISLKDDYHGNTRGSLFDSEDGRELQVYCGHPGVKTLLGRRLQDDDEVVKFENESSAPFRVALAELMTSVVVDYILADAESRQPGNFGDVGMVISERNRLVTKYLSRLQQLLLRTAKS